MKQKLWQDVLKSKLIAVLLAVAMVVTFMPRFTVEAYAATEESANYQYGLHVYDSRLGFTQSVASKTLLYGGDANDATGDELFDKTYYFPTETANVFHSTNHGRAAIADATVYEGDTIYLEQGGPPGIPNFSKFYLTVNGVPNGDLAALSTRTEYTIPYGVNSLTVAGRDGSSMHVNNIGGNYFYVLNLTVKSRSTTVGGKTLEQLVSAAGGTHQYTGLEISPYAALSTYFTISGTDKATNIGSYTVTLTPKTEYKWATGTDVYGARNFSWSIADTAGDAWRTANSAILAKTAATVTPADITAIDTALAQYAALNPGSKSNLAAQKTLLDAMKLAAEKQAAEKAINDKLEAQKNELAAFEQLSAEEKLAIEQELNSEASAAINNINAATTLTGIGTAKTAGIKALDDALAEAKLKNLKYESKAAIDQAATAKKNAIDALNNLTQDEKDTLKTAVDTAAGATKNAVDIANSLADVTSERDNGLAKLDLAEKKAQATDAINKKLADETAVVNGLANLTEEEQGAWIADLEDAADTAKTAVDSATSADEVNTAKTSGLDKMTVESEKATAIDAINKDLAEKKAAVDALGNLTDEEKAAKKAELDGAAAAAKEAVEDATTVAAVGTAKDTGLDNMNLIAEKANAVGAINKDLAAKMTAVDNMDYLSDAEKEAKKVELEEEANAAKDAVNAIEITAGVTAEEAIAAVTTAKDDGLNEMQDTLDQATAEDFVKGYLTGADDAVYTEATDDNYNDITDGKDAWDAFSDAVKDIVNKTLREASVPEDPNRTYGSLYDKADELKYDAKIGDTRYEFLEDAIKAAEDGETVEMLRNPKAETTAELAEGAAIKNTDNAVYTAKNGGSQVGVDVNGKITVKEGTLNCKDTLGTPVGVKNGEQVLEVSSEETEFDVTVEADGKAYATFPEAEQKLEVDGVAYESDIAGGKLYLPNPLAAEDEESGTVTATVLAGESVTTKGGETVSVPEGNADSLTVTNKGVTIKNEGDKVVIGETEYTAKSEDTVIEFNDGNPKLTVGKAELDKDETIMVGNAVVSNTGDKAVTVTADEPAKLVIPEGGKVTIGGSEFVNDGEGDLELPMTAEVIDFIQNYLTGEDGKIYNEVTAANYEQILAGKDVFEGLSEEARADINTLLGLDDAEKYNAYEEYLTGAEAVKEKVDDFVAKYLTDEEGKVYTEVTDYNYKQIISGSEAWEALSDVEKEAVNAKLKEAGAEPDNYPDMLKAAEDLKTAIDTAANNFVDKYVTGKDGNIYKEATKDNYKQILSGKEAWDKMTDGEKAAVNAILTADGGKTYEELLAAAQKLSAELAKTGDTTDLGMWLALLLASMGVTGVAYRRRKENI